MCGGEGSTIDDTIKIYVREAIYVRGHALLQRVGGKGKRGEGGMNLCTVHL